MRTARKRCNGRECHAPDCFAAVIEDGKFCRVCQALLDRVKQDLESGSERNRSVNGNTLPTVQSLDETTAASFDAGLKRRAKRNRPLTEPERLTRAVRIIQLRRTGESDDQIITHLCLESRAALEADLARYRDTIQSKASARVHDLKRDIALDREIVIRLKTHQGSRQQLAVELGISYSALASRITRLRRDGHEIPDARKTATVKDAA